MTTNNQKIKLVLLIDVLDDITGGAERQIYELSRLINKDLFEIYLFVIHEREVPREIKNIGIGVQCLGIRKTYGIKGIAEGFKLAKLLKQRNIDMLMTYHFASDIWGTFFAKLAGVPIIISNRRDEGFWRKKIHILAYRLINRWVNKIIVVSDAVKKMVLDKEKVSCDKIELLYNGVDLKRFNINRDIASKKRELGLPLDSKVIGCVGNLKPVKGHIFLIEAAQRIVKRYPDTHFILVGEDELQSNLKLEANKRGLNNNFHFLDKRNDIPGLLELMDICVLPSLSEGLSNVLLEYMAAGKPIIATGVGGILDVIENEKNGILVPPKNSISLEQEVLRLLENKDFAENLGANAKRTVKEKFDLTTQIELLETSLQNICAKKTNQVHTKNVKVMHLISSNGLFGAEKVMLNLASNMNCNNVKSWIVAVKNLHNPHTEIADIAEKMNVPVFTVESRGRFDLKAVSMLYDFIKRHNIDILYTHNFKADFLGLLAAKKARIPVVATLHGYIGRGLKLKLYELLDRFILRFFDKVIFVDDTLKKQFKNAPINAIVINNGVDVSGDTRYKTQEHKTQDTSRVLTIGTVGRLSEEKGHKYLLEAFSRVFKEYPDMKLIIIGDGELRKELEDLSISLGIKENVDFVGNQNELSKYYSLMDIYVSSSLIEHFPMAVLEAMGHEKAIVATDVGGTPNLIKDGKTGLLINPASSSDIYNALLILIKDKHLRKTLGRNAKSFVKDNCSLEKMVNSYKKVYEEVLTTR